MLFFNPATGRRDSAFNLRFPPAVVFSFFRPANGKLYAYGTILTQGPIVYELNKRYTAQHSAVVAGATNHLLPPASRLLFPP